LQSDDYNDSYSKIVNLLEVESTINLNDEGTIKSHKIHINDNMNEIINSISKIKITKKNSLENININVIYLNYLAITK